MEIKYYSIRGTLTRCSKEDFFQNGRIIENATYYIKDESTLLFKDRFVINEIYYDSVDSSDYKFLEKYYLKQIDYLTSKNLVYKLHDTYDNLKFNFKMYLQTATEFDIYYGSTNHMIINTTYFCITAENKIIGPFQIHDNHSPEKFREFLDKGILLIPTKKQLFEPVINSKAS